MRPPTSLRPVLVVATVLGLLVTAACSDDGDGTSSSSSSSSTTIPIPSDPELETMLLREGDLPPAFTVETGTEGADTITSFCAGEDAAAGLQASGRALVRIRREPVGVAVLQLVFRFRDDDAATFVRQAGEILQRCHEVPDAQGLAFSYEPATPAIDAVFADADDFVARYGSSVGSATFNEDIAVFRRGDVAQLVAVLAVDTPRAEVDALSLAAFTAAVDRSR